ncbi:V-type proton ATPase subunit H [Diutina catenulata]
MSDYTPLTIDSGYLSDQKKIIRERIIPWEGLARSGAISESEASTIKQLEKSGAAASGAGSELDNYTHTLVNVLNKVGDKDDATKNVLVAISDLLATADFADSMLKLSSADADLPYAPFVQVLSSKDHVVQVLALYDLTVLLTRAAKTGGKPRESVVERAFEVLRKLVGGKDANTQFIAVQLIQELVIVKSFKKIYENDLIANYTPLNQLVAASAKSVAGLQLSYNVLVTTWVLSFSDSINKVLTHHFPDLIGSLLQIAKDSIKLKIVRISVAILRNFVEVVASSAEQFKVIKLLMFHDALSTLKVLKERKFASNGSDEELSNDLTYLADKLDEVVSTKLTSLDEYLTELENPNLLSWTSPTHKSQDFWMDHAGKFKENSFKLVDKMFAILSDANLGTTPKVIVLNDIQYLIKNLGSDLITYINTAKGGRNKLLIMSFLDNNNGDNELKYEALKTIQMLVGHNY